MPSATAGWPAEQSPPDRRIVLIADDDPLLRSSLDSLFRSVGLETRLFASARDVMDAQFPDATCCIVMDIRMPRMSGLEFQAQLNARGLRVPIIFITGHGDIPMSVKAMKAGAFDFMTKPFRDQEMLDAVEAALSRDGDRRSQDKALADSRTRYEALTPREKEVMAGVTRGLLNKQVAAELGISEITVKLHRSSLMKKLEVRAFADLVRLAEALGVNNG
ncbi:response regulator transcription factor [Azospirillum sp. B506]|uniref:response regulator transcription factor n=1 Tax=Azospirillum sp. B506 TaxID=137721 RepID=UPI000348015E|nr:response regulator [Azospirillum sp. B506]